jgi:hypothetical protein
VITNATGWMSLKNSFLHLLLINLILYVTKSVLNMYLILFCLILNTEHWHENFVYSTRHVIYKYSTVLWLIRPVAERPPQRLKFNLGPPFLIRYKQVAIVWVFIQALPFSAVGTLPPMLRIVLCILIAVTS